MKSWFLNGSIGKLVAVLRCIRGLEIVSAATILAASTGGSFVPPVLGTAAFLMVNFAGIDYRDIAIAALLPAILYYVSIYAQVHFSCLRQGFGASIASSFQL